MKRLITLLLFAVVCAAQPPTPPTTPTTTAGQATGQTTGQKPNTPATPEPPKVEKAIEKHPAKIKAISDDRTELVIWKTSNEGMPNYENQIKLTVSEQVWKDNLKNWRAGDLANVSYEVTTTTPAAASTPPTISRALKDISPRYAKDIGRGDKWVFYLSLGIGLSLWVLLRRFIVGEDGFYSNSKLQMAIWFTLVIVGYLCTLFVRRFDFGAVQIPENLLLLSGLSVISFGGAKLVTQGKANSTAAAPNPNPVGNPAAGGANPAAGGANPANPPVSAAGGRVSNPNPPSIVSDLFTDNNGRADLADFQMIVITFLAVAVYAVQLSRFIPLIEMRYFVSLPDVDNTLLASFGLGQGAYLIKKAVGGINQ